MLMFNDMHMLYIVDYYNIVAVSGRCFEQCVRVSRLFRSLRNSVRLPQTDWLSLPGRHRGRQDTQGAQCCGNNRGDGRRVSTEPQVKLFVPVRAPNVFFSSFLKLKLPLLITGLTHLLLKHQSLHLFSNTNFRQRVHEFHFTWAAILGAILSKFVFFWTFLKLSNKYIYRKKVYLVYLQLLLL